MTLFDVNPTILEECQLCMHVDHEEKNLCDSYIVEFNYDPTCNYYDRGKYDRRIFILLNYLSSCWDCYRLFLLPCIFYFFLALIICLLIKCICIGSMLDLDVFVTCFMMLYFVSIAIFHVSIIKIINAWLKGFKEKHLLGDNPIFFLSVFQ